MTELFADTNYWIAVLNPADTLRRKVIEIVQELRPFKVVTSEMVLAELLNGVSRGGSVIRGAAADLPRRLQSRPDAILIEQTNKQFERALERYRKSPDKSWSLTDCASFLIMEERGIRAALTHDQHFAQAGFDALLR